MRRTGWIITALIACAVFAGAQTKITGTVYDLGGAVVPGASVEFIDKKSQRFRSSADRDGKYEIEVPPGLYIVRAEGIQFKTLTIKRYRVTQMESRKMNLDLSLEGKTISALRIK